MFVLGHNFLMIGPSARTVKTPPPLFSPLQKQDKASIYLGCFSLHPLAVVGQLPWVLSRRPKHQHLPLVSPETNKCHKTEGATNCHYKIF
jgi:hypothetical protein